MNSPSPKGAAKQTLRGHRSVLLLLSAVVIGVALMLLLGGNDTSGGGSDPGGDRGATEAPSNSVTGKLDGLSEGPGDLGNGGDASKPSAAPPRSTGANPFIAIGELHDKRLYAFELSELIAAAKRGVDGNELIAAGLSPVVGSPLAAAYAGPDLVLASTNVRTLVKLTPKWDVAKELSITEAIGSGASILRYGGIVAVDESHVAVSVAFSNKLAVVLVDVPTFTVSRSKVFNDRFAGFPSMCRTDTGNLFVVSTGFVDVLAPKLDRVATLPTDWAATATACVGSQAWISDNDKPSGRIVNEQAKEVGTFQWSGSSSSYLRYSPDTGRVYGSDQTSGAVFSCPQSGGQCVSSKAIGKKPTDLLVQGPYILVTLEGDGAVAVLRTTDLGVEGLVRFPGSPRTVTRMAV